MVEIWSKFGRSFDIGGGRSLVGFGLSLVEVRIALERCGCRSLVEISTKLRPPSVEVWSKSLPSFDTPVSNICTYKFQYFDMTDPDCGRELWVHIRINRFTIILIYMCTYIYIYYVYVYIKCIYIYIYTQLYIHICVTVFICVYVYIYICLYTYAYIYIYIYIYMYRYIWICIDIHYPKTPFNTHTYIYIYIYIFIYLVTYQPIGIHCDTCGYTL